MAKRGRPSKYDNARVNTCATKYINSCKKKHEIPTFEQLSGILKVGTRTLSDWEQEYPEFLLTMDILRGVQKDMLIRNGLNGKFNSRFAMFLLKANHKLHENEPLVTNTSENYLNIQPEVLADAIRIMRSKEESGEK